MVFIEIEDKRLTVGEDKPMNTDEILEHPARRGMRGRLTGLMGKGLPLSWQLLTKAVFQGRLDQQTQRHHPPQGHDALGGFKVERGGQE